MFKPQRFWLFLFVLLVSSVVTLFFAPTTYAAECGMNIDPFNAGGAPTGGALKGVKWVRIEYKDCSTQSPPTDSITTFRGVLQRYKSYGIKTLVILDYQTYPNAANDLDKFAERAGYINKELGGLIDAYEIWNEPDHPRHYPLDAAKFADVVNAVAPKLSGDIVLGGFASGNPGYLSSALQKITASYTAIGVHPYDKSVPSSTAGGSGSMIDLMNQYRKVAPGKKIWITEIGLGSTDNSQVAQYMNGVYSAGVADVIIWFDWSDAMVKPFGITDASQAPKQPIFETFFKYACGVTAPAISMAPAAHLGGGSCGGPSGSSSSGTGSGAGSAVANISANLAKEIDDFLGAGADGYIVWQYSGNKGAGEIFASDPYSFWQGTPEGDAVCAVLKQKADQYKGKFVGVNMWDLGNHDPAIIKKHFQWLNSQCGVTVVRTFVKAGGPEATTKILDAASGTGVKILFSVGDYSNGSPGLPSGVSTEWYKSGYKDTFAGIVKQVRDAVQGNANLWGVELANEAHCRGDKDALQPYQAWGQDLAGLFKGNIGYGQKSSENTTLCDSPGVQANGTESHFEYTNKISQITITSAHYYTAAEKALSLQALQQAKKLGKIFYIGEAGFNLKNLSSNTYSQDKPDDFYITPLLGFNPKNSEQIATDLIKQGYEARCAAPSFSIKLDQSGVEWMKKYLDCGADGNHCNSPLGEGGVFGGISIGGRTDTIGPNPEGNRVTSLLSVDYRNALIPIFRDLDQVPQLKRSLEDYFGYKAPPASNYTNAELNSAPINSLLSREQRCTQSALSLRARDEMCKKLKDPSACALYTVSVPDTSYTVQSLLNDYENFASGSTNDGETCTRLVAQGQSDLRTAMLDLPLQIDKAYRLAFLVTTIRTKVPLAGQMMNLFQHPKRGPLGDSPDPAHVVIVTAFKVPDITTNKGTIDSVGPSGDTPFNDPAILTRNVLIPAQTRKDLDAAGEAERKRLLDTYLTQVDQKPQDDHTMEIQCMIDGVSSQQCKDALTRALVDIINAQALIENENKSSGAKPTSSVAQEQLFKLECDDNAAETPAQIFDSADIHTLNNPGRVFSKNYGVALLEQLFEDETHLKDSASAMDPTYADTNTMKKDATEQWGLKSIFHVIPANQPFGDDSTTRAVKHFIVYPEGYDLKTVEAVLGGTFFSSQQINALQDKAKQYQGFEIKDEQETFAGGSIGKTYTDHTVRKNDHYCDEEYTVTHNDGSQTIKVDPCPERSFSFTLTETKEPKPHQILGGRLGYWLHTIQEDLYKSSSAMHAYLQNCASTEEFLLDQCGGAATPGTAGTDIPTDFSDIPTFNITYWNGAEVTFQPPSQELWANILSASSTHGCDPWLVLAAAHAESPTFTNETAPNQSGEVGLFQFDQNTWTKWATSNEKAPEVNANHQLSSCDYWQPTTFHAQAFDFSSRTNLRASIDTACRKILWSGMQRYSSDAEEFRRRFAQTGDSPDKEAWKSGDTARATYVFTLWAELLKRSKNTAKAQPAGYPYPICDSSVQPAPTPTPDQGLDYYGRTTLPIDGGIATYYSPTVMNSVLDYRNNREINPDFIKNCEIATSGSMSQQYSQLQKIADNNGTLKAVGCAAMLRLGDIPFYGTGQRDNVRTVWIKRPDGYPSDMPAVIGPIAIIDVANKNDAPNIYSRFNHKWVLDLDWYTFERLFNWKGGVWEQPQEGIKVCDTKEECQ